jgi:prephenate dehydrogenase
VAAGDPKLWQPIFATNRAEVLAALDRFMSKMAAVRESLDQADDRQLGRILEQAKTIKRRHDALGD